jgi:hypothetical protein
MLRTRLAGALALVLAGCGGASSLAPVAPANFSAVAPPAKSWWYPTVGETFQIQYDGKLDLSVPADVYDLDMFDTRPETVRKLHAMGRKVVCYIDVGTWEKWRPDAKKFPKSVLGRPDGHWPGERWLDIRQTQILEPIMGARYDRCKKKGFDAIDPDNLAGYQSRTGFPLNAKDQITYNTWVANAAHARGLGVDQKNDNNQLKELASLFDFGVDEQCFVQGWCHQLTIFTNNNRLAVDVEYTNQIDRSRFLAKTCPSDSKYNVTPMLKHLELTAWIVTCSGGSASPPRSQ